MNQIFNEVSAWLIGAAAITAVFAFAAGYYFGKVEKVVDNEHRKGGIND